jgi:hypothetical protein
MIGNFYVTALPDKPARKPAPEPTDETFVKAVMAFQDNQPLRLHFQCTKYERLMIQRWDDAKKLPNR